MKQYVWNNVYEIACMKYDAAISAPSIHPPIAWRLSLKMNRIAQYSNIEWQPIY